MHPFADERLDCRLVADGLGNLLSMLDVVVSQIVRRLGQHPLPELEPLGVVLAVYFASHPAKWKFSAKAKHIA